MTSDKDHLFWNALRKSRRVRSPVLGGLLMLLGCCAGTGVGWWMFTGPFAASGRIETGTSPWLSGEAGALCYGLLTALPFFLLGKRLFSSDAHRALMTKDGGVRPFVLYLRAFHADAGWHGWFTEPRLGRVLKRVGPPICVGRPGERLPPYGFHRIYFADDDWRQSVLTMAAHARLIVVLIGETQGLAWEITQLLERNWLDKTILLLPARNHEKYRQQLLTEHGVVVPDLQAHYAPAISWRRFDLCPVEFLGPRRQRMRSRSFPGKA